MSDASAEHIVREYNDGPWASTGSDSCVDVAGYWHFPGPDVSAEAEVKRPIRIVPVKQGFVVDHDLAFTDAVDLAEWLLEWLGLESERERLAVLDFRWDLDEAKRTLDVARAAWVYIRDCGGDCEEDDVYLLSGAYKRLAEAVKKWRGIDGEEAGEAAKRRGGLT